MHDEGNYTCDACGEEIVIPLDLSAGTRQDFVEDCPVCCRPNVIHVEVEEDGSVSTVGRGRVMDRQEAGQLLAYKLAEYRKLSYAEDRQRRLSRGDR